MKNLNEENFNIVEYLWRPEVNSFNRMEAFLEVCDGLSDAEYWRGLKDAYTSSDDLYNLRHKIKKAFFSNRPERECLMGKEDYDSFLKLPERIKVFRGMSRYEFINGEFNIGWTLDYNVAHFFAFTYGRNIATMDAPKLVASAYVDRQDVIAYLSDREEKCIILNPEKLVDLRHVLELERLDRN